MSCCPTDPIICNFGTHGHCDVVALPVIAPMTDTYTLEWDFLGSRITKLLSMTIGEPFSVNGNWFNENATIKLRVYDSSGNQISYTTTIDDVEYSCNEFDLRFVISNVAPIGQNDVNINDILNIETFSDRAVQIFGPLTGDPSHDTLSVTEFTLPADTSLINIEINGINEYEAGTSDTELEWSVNGNSIVFNQALGSVDFPVWVAVRAFIKSKLVDLI